MGASVSPNSRGSASFFFFRWGLFPLAATRESDGGGGGGDADSICPATDFREDTEGEGTWAISSIDTDGSNGARAGVVFFPVVSDRFLLVAGGGVSLIFTSSDPPSSIVAKVLFPYLMTIDIIVVASRSSERGKEEKGT